MKGQGTPFLTFIHSYSVKKTICSLEMNDQRLGGGVGEDVRGNGWFDMGFTVP